MEELVNKLYRGIGVQILTQEVKTIEYLKHFHSAYEVMEIGKYTVMRVRKGLLNIEVPYDSKSGRFG